MPGFVVNATGLPTQRVKAENWMDALGQALGALGLLDQLEALACEILPNETVVARNVKSGQGFVVMRSEGEGTPAPAVQREERSHEPFGVHNLAQSVFQENLSHELRTPLNNILGYAGMLMEESHDRQLPRMAEDLRRVADSARSLLELVDAGLEANRVATEEIAVHRLTFDVSELLEDAAAAFQSEALRRRNRVEVVDRVGGEMRADPALLRTALLEMLAWANERVTEGVIALSADLEVDGENAEWVRLRVQDDAPFSDADASGLFEVMAAASGAEGAAAATIRRAIARDLCRRQGGELGLLHGPDGSAGLGIRIGRGR